MRDRMQYLRFMYTCLFEASTFGGSCFDPLYFHYTQDEKARENVFGTNDTFIFGNAVKVSPLITPSNGAKTFKSYFPKGKWLNLANMQVKDVTQDGPVDLDIQPTVNVHLRPGSIVPWQDFMSNLTAYIRTTNDVIGKPISLVINRNERKFAKGTLFLDDGISLSEISG
jgi:alpha-glucosidase (family GH31 glycosyl hydrolase)